MNILFRNAQKNQRDARLIMTWRNDPVTLAMFYHQEPKVFRSFWSEYLSDYFRHSELPPVFALIADHEVAFLRNNFYLHPKLPHNCVDIDINVAPKMRGKGIGTAVILAMTTRLLKRYDCVAAEVKKSNTASIKAFKNAGFSIIGTDEHVVDGTNDIIPIVILAAG